MLIYNNVAGPAPTNLTIANPDGSAFSHPALITSQAVGQELAALAAAGPVTVEMEAKPFTEFRQTTNLWAETSGDPDRTVVVEACDTLTNVKLSLLHEMTDAAAHATYTFGLTKAEIVDQGVLRPGTDTPDTEADTAAGSGDGGLHPRHDEEELLDS